VIKEELLEKLKFAVKTEESAIPVYTKHISDTLFLSEFGEAEKKAIVGILETLSSDSQRHAALYKSFVDGVERSNKNVY